MLLKLGLDIYTVLAFYLTVTCQLKLVCNNPSGSYIKRYVDNFKNLEIRVIGLNFDQSCDIFMDNRCS